MANTITLIPTDEEAHRILEQFEQRTGLSPEEDGGRRIYAIEGEAHRIRIVHTLDEIDEHWPAHIDLGSPA